VTSADIPEAAEAAEGAREGGELAELAALADGSLPPQRREELEARVAASPRLQALLAEQRAALRAVLGRDERAPARLHEAVAARAGAERRPARPARRRRLAALGAGLAAAAVAVLLLVALPGSEEPAPPGLAEAAAFAARPPTSGAPVSRGGERVLAGVAVEGVRYPDWAREYGWRARGSRVDRLGSHRAVTVFYEKRARRVGYTIVSRPPLALPRSSRAVSLKGHIRRLFSARGHAVVTWQRRGHTCVLSGAGIRARTLVRLTV